MKRMAGFTLVEIMVAIALSLVLMAGAITIFYGTRLSYQATDESSRIQETGRLALELMLRDVRNSGWQGCSRSVPVSNVLNGSDETLWDFAIPVDGFDVSASNSGTWVPALPAVVTGPAPLDGNDVLVVRGPRREARPLRTVTEMIGGDDPIEAEYFSPAPIAPGDVVQIADCAAIAWFRASGYTTAGEITRVAANGVGNNSSTDLGLAFREGAELVPVETVIYYIGQGETGGPALYRKAGTADPVEVFDGVEGLQVAFGIDDNADFSVDRYLGAGDMSAADRGNVVAVNVAMLVRGPDEPGVDVDRQDYNLLGVVYPDGGGGFGDRRRREIYEATVTLRNRVQ